MKTRKELTFEDVVKLHVKKGWGFNSLELKAFEEDDWSLATKQYLHSKVPYQNFLKEYILELDKSYSIGKLCVFGDTEIHPSGVPYILSILTEINNGRFINKQGREYTDCMELEDFIKLYGEKK